MKLQNIIKQYPKSHHAFVKLFWHLCERIDAHEYMDVTSYLNPREVAIAYELGAHFKRIHIYKNTYYEQANFGTYLPEKRRLCVMHQNLISYCEPEFFEGVIRIGFSSKYVQLTHRMILGTLANSGYDLQKMGDILVYPDRAYLFGDVHLLNEIERDQTTIGKYNVQMIQDSAPYFEPMRASSKQKEIMVASLRLDAVLAAMYPVRREEVQKMCRRGYVSVDYTIQEKTTLQLSENTLLSLRGHGRCTIQCIRVLRSGKYMITAEYDI